MLYVRNSPLVSFVTHLGAAEDIVRSFSHVIQDNQFAALGLVLFAELARIHCLIGDKPTDPQDTAQSTDVDLHAASTASAVRLDEDVGEAVERTTDTNIPPESSARSNERSHRDTTFSSSAMPESSETSLFPVQQVHSMATESSEANTDEQEALRKRHKHRKRKGANAIDDLLRGLD